MNIISKSTRYIINLSCLLLLTGTHAIAGISEQVEKEIDVKNPILESKNNCDYASCEKDGEITKWLGSWVGGQQKVKIQTDGDFIEVNGKDDAHILSLVCISLPGFKNTLLSCVGKSSTIARVASGYFESIFNYNNNGTITENWRHYNHEIPNQNSGTIHYTKELQELKR